jgi:hypothetical protein
LARRKISGMRSTEPISAKVCNTSSLAPPCNGPHRAAIAAAVQAYGLARSEPTKRIAEVEAFCSWSACVISTVSRARAAAAGAR